MALISSTNRTESGEMCAVPEIPDSRLFILTSKRRFVPVWASLNRGFRGLVRCTSCDFFWPRNTQPNIAHRPTEPLWRAKKSHFKASVEMGMKNVDKDAVNTTIGLLCYLVAWKFSANVSLGNVVSNMMCQIVSRTQLLDNGKDELKCWFYTFGHWKRPLYFTGWKNETNVQKLQ